MRNRQTHRGEPGTSVANASASYTAAATSSIDTTSGTSATETETGATNSAPTDEAAERYLPTPTLMHSIHGVDTDPAQPRHQHQPRPWGPHLAMVRRMRWKKVVRKRKGKGEEKKTKDQNEGSVPSWADKARDNGVYVTVFIGGNRDARPHKACNPKEDTVWEEERARRPIPVITGVSTRGRG